MAGRKPKPTHLKLVQGNPGKRKIKGKEPQPEKKKLSCPPWLGEHAKVFWKEIEPVLYGLELLTIADKAKLELLCVTYGEWRRASDAVAQHGEVYETTNLEGVTMYRPRPEVAMRSDAAKRLSSLLSEFGLDPSSRTRLGVDLPGGKKKDDLEDILNG